MPKCQGISWIMKEQMPNKALKAKLKERGVKQKDIAKMLGITAASVSEVVRGRRKNPRIRLALAFAVGLPVSDLWPPTKNTSAPAGRNTPSVGDVGGTADPSRG